MPGSFVDSNVLIYLASGDPDKAERAEAVLRDGNAIISVQVLNEIAAVGRRKMQLSWAELGDFLAAIRAILPVHPLTEDTHVAGLALAEDHGFSLYDAMIVASALEAGCDVLWSEDMQDGRVIKERLRIRNPFHRHVP
jgi:predicted nucleic acid-binding protein